MSNNKWYEDGRYGLLAAYWQACGSSWLARSKGWRTHGAVLNSTHQPSAMALAALP